ncbi:hypothetical protein EYR36_006907 [Pleurotus pulmonarius]|nr:hypothetical protein EYR36_006907 [Pleurotus pulmonarius]KAF4580335.1 hypothetical protein EYR38_003231 [Pleurotus pulmonarius]
MQFMAREILKSTLRNKPVEHTVSHDLESFAWVFAYVVLRRLLLDSADETNLTVPKDARIAVEALYEQSFGALKLETVLTQRYSLRVFNLEANNLDGLVPAIIADFMVILGAQVAINYVVHAADSLSPLFKAVLPASLPSQTNMTHSNLIQLIDAAIQTIVNEAQINE